MHWDPYFMVKDQYCATFLQKYFDGPERNVLLICGQGFDERSGEAAKLVDSVASPGRRDCLVIRSERLGRRNGTILPAVASELDSERWTIVEREVVDYVGDPLSRRRVTSRRAAALVDEFDFKNYNDVIIDISAIPRGCYWSLIGKVLADAKAVSGGKLNVFAFGAESVRIDNRIRSTGLDEKMDYMFGLQQQMLVEATSSLDTIWIPLIGENQGQRLDRLYGDLSPSEICPVLPSPSNNPRRADDLLGEYDQLFFDSWNLQPGNIIYADEANPFEAYRVILRTAHQYEHALQPIGGCKIAISSPTTKLLSIGALMATLELMEQGSNVGLAHVDSTGYDYEEASKEESEKNPVSRVLMGLDGDFYSV